MLPRAILLVTGFAAVIAQIVLIRELMVVFHGNEASLGLILASWLAWTALGSAVLGRFSALSPRPRLPAAVLASLSAVTLPLSIAAVRYARSVFQTVPGELLGPGQTLLAAVVVLAPFCTVSGALFAAGSRLWTSEIAVPPGEATGNAYLIESVGGAVGGLLASLALIQSLSPFEIAALLAWLNLSAAGLLLAGVGNRRQVAVLALAASLLPFLFTGARLLEGRTLARVWRGFHVTETIQSFYGNLTLVTSEGSATLYQNGLPIFTAPDPAAAEESVHYALLEHPAPRTVLLIGGGVNGSVTEALRDPTIDRLDYVELDPKILDLARRRFPEEWSAIGSDSRVHVHSGDGRFFLKTTPGSFDVIIVNLPDPRTAQLNRFYTLEFFREAASKLNSGGLLSLRLSGAENYIGPELAGFLRSIHKTLRLVFPEVAALPGGTIHFFAAAKPGTLASGANELIERLRSRNLRTTYVREYYLPFRMMPDRLADLESQIRPLAETPVNRDFTPVAYYFDIALWSTRFHPKSGGLFQALAGISFGGVVLITLLILAIVAALLHQVAPGSRRRSVAGFCVGAMGFTLMALQVLLLLAFQAVYGYVYHQLAVLIACFMGGIALGSWLALRRPLSGMVSLAALQAMAAVSAPLLVGASVLLAKPASTTGLFVTAQLAFPALAVASGLLGGFQFPVASRVFFEKESRSQGLGALYALDLAGACIGALTLSAWLVPVFGFGKTAFLVAAANLVPAAMAAITVPQRSV
jgi:spermidine synthase